MAVKQAHDDIGTLGPSAESAAHGDEAGASMVIDGVLHEFPGCRPVHIGRDEIADHDGRYEFWDAKTETALMVCEPTSPYHERSSVRLARMTDRIAAASGIDIEVLGASDLLLRDKAGNRHRILQADQIVYTRPIMARPLGHAVEVAADEIPDVVLEVDLTTDVRRGKLKLYESWGFPEVWVEVPEERAPSRPNRTPGLTIHRLGKGGYGEIETSEAFPTWTGAEIHAGMNEHRFGKPVSDTTAAVLRRVGRLMGAAVGSGPENDPFLRAERAESRDEGRIEMLREVLRGILEMRDIAPSPQFDERLTVWSDLPVKAMLASAQVSTDEDDFWRRLALAWSSREELARLEQR